MASASSASAASASAASAAGASDSEESGVSTSAGASVSAASVASVSAGVSSTTSTAASSTTSSAGAALSSAGAAFESEAYAAASFFALFGFGFTGSSTSSICTMDALSPLRKPSFVMRVYPPSRSSTRGAISVKSSCTTFLSWMTASTRRRAWRSPRFAKVMRRSATGRRRLALVSVVLMLLCVNRAAARFASKRRSCAGPPPRRGPLVGAAIVRFLSLFYVFRRIMRSRYALRATRP